MKIRVQYTLTYPNDDIKYAVNHHYSKSGPAPLQDVKLWLEENGISSVDDLLCDYYKAREWDELDQEYNRRTGRVESND